MDRWNCAGISRRKSHVHHIALFPFHLPVLPLFPGGGHCTSSPSHRHGGPSPTAEVNKAKYRQQGCHWKEQVLIFYYRTELDLAMKQFQIVLSIFWTSIQCCCKVKLAMKFQVNCFEVTASLTMRLNWCPWEEGNLTIYLRIYRPWRLESNLKKNAIG